VAVLSAEDYEIISRQKQIFPVSADILNNKDNKPDITSSTF
jgi:hypothetical protein